jgi:hypothetical protein
MALGISYRTFPRNSGFLSAKKQEPRVMPDKLNERAPQDASRISLGEDWEVRYWTKALGVSEDRLRQLVHEHGHSADALRRALGKAA